MAKVQTVTREAMRPLIEPHGLCEAVRAGDALYVAGQTGIDPATHRVVVGGMKAQALQAFRNIRAVVEAAGGRADQVVQFTWYLVEGPEGRSFMEDALDVTAARNEVFPGLVSGSTAVRVRSLLLPELLIEVQAVAAL
ncbi:MAG TPA: RidA family protein [Caulobacteraceae bacterium]|jgi:enamine deaminase RidA (YjgF/YER057c/UK114 family)|nr:RidA family protein [Caulobacteraceae bacterium]